MKVYGTNSVMPMYQLPRSFGLKNSPHSTQSPHTSSGEGGRLCGVQQKRLAVPHEDEQKPSFRSNRAISTRMIRNAITADKTPMIVAATHPCRRSQLFTSDPRNERFAACRSRRTREDSLIWSNQRLVHACEPSCNAKSTYGIVEPVDRDIGAVPDSLTIGGPRRLVIFCVRVLSRIIIIVCSRLS